MTRDPTERDHGVGPAADPEVGAAPPVAADPHASAPGVSDPDATRSGRRRLPWRSALVAALLAAAGWAVWRFLEPRPDLAEALLGSGFHPELIRTLTRISGLVPLPFAVAELLLLAVLAWVVSLPVRILWERRRTGAWQAASARGGLRFVRGVGLLLFGFYLLWGWQYARPGLDARLGFPPSGVVPDDELMALAEALVDRTNVLYLELHGSDDAGVPTALPEGSRSSPVALAAMNEAWERAVLRWELPEAMARPRPGPRTLLTTPVLRRLGMAGVYAPWTGEALIMADLAGASFHFTAAHESGHQRGIARESDANAMAYLLALDAPAAETRYAAALFLQRQTLQALARRDSETVLRLVQSRHRGVQRDVEAIAARARAVAGPAGDLTRQANDAMLRRHGISEGVASYGGSLWIVAALARDLGVEALLPPTDPDHPGAALP
ncbi:hypothetical protein BH23GEM11_BH23GEM11_14790 [soil metagenome]